MNIQLNEEILQFLLDYRSQHPEFTFATRVKNSKNKLDEGYWFQGNERYIFVGFYKLGNSKSKTKTIGFVIELRDGAVVNNHVSIVYPMDLSEQFVLLHKKIKDKIDSLHILELKETWKDKRFEFIFKNTDWKENLSLFLDKIQPLINTEIKALHCEKEMFISEDIFKQNFSKITSVKSITDDENLLKLLRRIGEQASLKYFDYANRLMTNLNVSRDDVRISYTCRDFKRLAIIIGHRTCFVYVPDDSLGMNWHFILQKQVQKDNIHQSVVFKETDGVISAYYQTTNDDTNIGLLFDGICDASKFELERTNKSHNRKSNSEVFEKAIFDEEYRKHLFKTAFDDLEIKSKLLKKMNVITDQPLNQILYGPPGTGKTYSTVEYAYKIINGNDAFEANGYDKAKQWFKDELAKADSDDRQLDFITFHQNYSYEDFVIGIKPDLNEGNGLSFKKHEGIFYKICQRALGNLKQTSEEGSAVEPIFYEVFDDFIRPLVEENLPIVIPMKSTNFSFKLININERSIGFEKQSGGTSHTLSIKTIQELYEGNREYNLQGLGVYYNPLIETLKALAKKKTKIIKSVSPKNYVIIIDEINRANISRVFGELITLIEDDKRWGNEHAMEVRLPDGHTKFTVPKNLYIIGTMNTADKSIALLDIALRRRFEFTAKYPDSKEVNEKYKTFFETLNKDIIARKGIDFTIGHSYFRTQNDKDLDFVKTMNQKVIPLLCEYFYNIKDNTVVVKIIENAIKNGGLSYEVVPNDYQICIK